MEPMNIEQLYQHVISLMKNDSHVTVFSQKLAQLQDNSKRVNFVYDLLKKYKVFPKLVKLKKDSERSTKYRNMGNDFFKTHSDSKALKMYNSAIVNAPNNSRELALAYANRSAVLFSLMKYNECVCDIERAIKVGYDDTLMPKLLKRKSLCEIAISENCTIDEVDIQCQRQFKLSKDQNPLIPCASKSVEIAYSESMGRSVVATENIVPGEVLVIEQPYCCIVLEPLYLEYCYGCLKRCDSMIPCKSCCFVMFCNSECFDKAWLNYHHIECDLMPLLSSMKFTKLELLAFRTVIQTKCTLIDWMLLFGALDADSINDPKMKGFSKSNNSKNSPDIESKVFDSSNYVAIHTLVTNIEKRSVSDIFQKSVTAAVCLNMLIYYSDLFYDCDETFFPQKKQCVSVIGGLLLHHNMTGPSNMHTISALTGTKETGFVDCVQFGGGAYAFLSLLNHSCAPNVVRYCNGTDIALVALRPIQKGQQLFDNYGFHHATDKYVDRRKLLRFQYKFECSCEACVNDWPLYHNLKPACITDKKKEELVSHNILTEKLINDLKFGNRSVALNIVNQLYPYVTILEESAPSSDLAQYQETIKQCWSLFGNVVPLK